jgi:hypothetical protein
MIIIHISKFESDIYKLIFILLSASSIGVYEGVFFLLVMVYEGVL